MHLYEHQTPTHIIRHVKAKGTQLVWALDYSVHLLNGIRYIIYNPDPLSALTLADLSGKYGLDHEQAALMFLAGHALPKGKFAPMEELGQAAS